MARPIWACITHSLSPSLSGRLEKAQLSCGWDFLARMQELQSLQTGAVGWWVCPSKLQERAGLCCLHLLLPPQGCAAGLGEASETPGCAGAPVGPLWLKTRAGNPVGVNPEMMENWPCLTPRPLPPSPRGQWLAGLTHPWVLLNKTLQLQPQSGSGAGPGVLELQGSSWPAFPAAAAQCQAAVHVELCEVQQGKERGVVPWWLLSLRLGCRWADLSHVFLVLGASQALSCGHKEVLPWEVSWAGAWLCCWAWPAWLHSCAPPGALAAALRESNLRFKLVF